MWFCNRCSAGYRRQKTRLDSPWPTSAVKTLENRQITNTHWASKVAEYEAGLSNLPGTITHALTLMMDLDHVSKTPLSRSLCEPRCGYCLESFVIRSERDAKGGNYTPRQVLRSISAAPNCMMGLVGPRAKLCYTWPQRGQIKGSHHGSGLGNVNRSHGSAALYSPPKLLVRSNPFLFFLNGWTNVKYLPL